jgi:DNA gyrase/topoisomerase IV subunit A
LINQDQIEDWIHEVEDRPHSAPLIIRYIANRLRTLTDRNEELLAENIELRTGRKVEDYESRIANLEYQLDLLKRQLGEGSIGNLPVLAAESVSLVAYTVKGRMLRLELTMNELASSHCVFSLAIPSDEAELPRLVATSPTEELLFVFDSGRTTTLPVSEIPVVQKKHAGWENAFLVEPHGGEELVTILPVARMTLFDCCLQISRRGCAKKMMKTSFESHVAKSYVGTGVKSKPDKTFDLTLCGNDDLLVLASREGYVWSLDVNQLPYTIEEVVKLGTTDFLSASFTIRQTAVTDEKGDQKSSILFLTQNRKVIHREADWLEKPASYKSRGQQVFSQARRGAGVRVVGAVAVDEKDWGAALSTNGQITVHRISDLLEVGVVSAEDETSIDQTDILEFVTFSGPGPVKV